MIPDCHLSEVAVWEDKKDNKDKINDYRYW